VLAALLLIHSVSVPGTQLDVKLATQVGQPYDAATVERDVRTLYSMGRFRDVRVETVEGDEGPDIIFHVTAEPQYPLHEVRIRPHTFGLQISLPAGTVVSQPRANELAQLAQKQLVERGYARAKVTASLEPVPGGKTDVMLDVVPGEALRLKATGDPTVKPPKWYSTAAVESHAARLRSIWVAKGYFDARITTSEELGAKHAMVDFRVDPGPFYHPIDTKTLCSSLFTERRAAERKGILDFQPITDEDGNYRIEQGRSYTVGQIKFVGSTHYSDAVIRKQFLLDEGVPLDSWVLRQSVVRLNRAGMFEPVDERQVHLQTDERTGIANIVVNLTERKRGAWNFGGPVPITGSISARLPSFGSGIFEGSTYTASFNAVAYSTILKLATNRKFLPVFSLDRPFTPGTGWLSGISIAPQLGPQWIGISYAITQLEQRLGPVLAGTRVPDLPYTLSRSSGDVPMLCEAPKPKLHIPRIAAGMALGLLKTLTN
jgi:Surface antigen variable number repeat